MLVQQGQGHDAARVGREVDPTAGHTKRLLRAFEGVAQFGSGPAGWELQGTAGGTVGDVPEAQDQTLIVLGGLAGQQGTAGEVDVEGFQAGGVPNCWVS